MSPSSIEIAQAAEARPITDIAADLGLPPEALVPYGADKAKVSLDYLGRRSRDADRSPGRLVLVTAITPTPAGEGKTTTSIGLADGLARLGERTIVCLREPALGPVFGMKGGAAGGGYAQVIPMEEINLHFTGDMHAIGAATNLLAAMVDNHLHHGNALRIDARRVSWRRALDVNDRALRDVVVGLGGPAKGYPREAGFDITVASEVMAIFCLATGLADLRDRLGRIVVARTVDGDPVTAADLRANGAMAVLLRDALAPNLVQTLEHTPAFVHGGPFANIAHGASSVIATSAALDLADYVITEGGFGADLGAEKFVDIVCRSADFRPALAVLVVTVRALKHHGGATDLADEDVDAVTAGLPNLEHHLRIVRDVLGLPCLVAINHRADDTDAEVAAVLAGAQRLGVRAVVSRHFAKGGAGATDLARAVVEKCGDPPDHLAFAYSDEAHLWDKADAVVRRVYGAAGVTASATVRADLRRLQDEGYGALPVCVAKSPYSFSGTGLGPGGAPDPDAQVQIREVRLAAGARFVVLVCGSVMTMPGLPSRPAAESIDLADDGRIIGLF